jgi:hypothetical protein
MATGREPTDEERWRLVSEAQGLARAAGEGPSAPFEPSGIGEDAILASLATHAGVDDIRPTGGWSWLKKRTLKLSASFRREQATFNRLTVTALEELSARMDALEAQQARRQPPSGG